MNTVYEITLPEFSIKHPIGYWAEAKEKRPT